MLLHRKLHMMGDAAAPTTEIGQKISDLIGSIRVHKYNGCDQQPTNSQSFII